MTNQPCTYEMTYESAQIWIRMGFLTYAADINLFQLSLNDDFKYVQYGLT